MKLQKTQLGSKSPQQKSTKSLLTTINTGYNIDQCDEIPIPEIVFIDLHEHNKSILDSVETGFDKQNTLSKQCEEPQYFITLYNENFLNEFKTEQEKEKVRENLDVYGKSEVSKIVSDVINDNTLSFITKIVVEKMINDLDFVDSTSRSYVNYEIPDKLFKL